MILINCRIIIKVSWGFGISICLTFKLHLQVMYRANNGGKKILFNITNNDNHKKTRHNDR